VNQQCAFVPGPEWKKKEDGKWSELMSGTENNKIAVERVGKNRRELVGESQRQLDLINKK